MKKKHVLVVEDYDLNQDLLELQLQEMGCVVFIANNGVEAVEYCNKESIELVFMDINMPIMNGCEAAKKIRESESKCKNVPIIAMSANADKEIEGNCRSCGMNDIVIKPVGKRVLSEILERWLSDDKQSDTISSVVSVSLKKVCDQNVQDKDIYLNYEKALEEFCGNVVLLNNSLKSFLINVDNQIVPVKKAILDNDLEFVKLQMHKISGAAANLTAVSLSKLAAVLENMAEAQTASFEDLNISFLEFEKFYIDFKEHVVHMNKNK
ncbi:MAG: response regulator [Candidatus Omnitrophica bacterium]|nr:response regulator [Candidatus Omnitrophota bacterium]MBU1996052.1 response regulator [Candidatus Omnitrophota bacterium]